MLAVHEEVAAAMAAGRPVVALESTIIAHGLPRPDNLRVADALREHNYAPKEHDCVLIDVPHKPGMLRTIAEKLAWENIDIEHLYVTAALETNHCLVVFSSSNNDHAVVALNR